MKSIVKNKVEPKNEKQSVDAMLRSVSVVPDSFDAATNTITLVAATEAEVMQFGWNGAFAEVLSMDASHIRLDRLNSSANVLDNHNSYGSVREAVVGVVEKAWIEKKQLMVSMRFSNREDVKPLIQDVKDGIIKQISVRYRVYAYEIDEVIGKTPIYTAVDWEPAEVSFVSVPADYMAGVRNNNSSQKNLVEVKYTKKVHTEGMRNEGGVETSEVSTTETAATETAAPAAKPAVATPAAPADAARSAAKIERERSSEIFRAVRAAGFGIEYAEELIKGDLDVDGVRAAVLDKLAGSQSTAQTRGANAGITVKADETDKRRAGMRNAILVRSGISEVKEDNKIIALNAGEFRGMNLIDMGRECLEIAGVKTRGMSAREVAMSALGLGDSSVRALSSSDFPSILGNTVNRSLRSAYDLAEKTFQPFCRRGTVKDFRAKTVAQLGDLASIDLIEEGAEYKNGKFDDAAESYKVVKYGKIIPITWETLVNDDLDAFSRIPAMLANACAQKQSDLIYNILTGNPNMSDGNPVFDATNHKNYTSTGTAISVASLGVARAMLRKQKSPGGSFLNLRGKYLVTGPDQEQLALQFLSSNYVATKGSDINVWQGSMTPIIEGRLTGTQWYVFADPATIDTIEYSFLDGEEIFTEQRVGFDVDGMQMKVRMVFGAKAIEYRSLYKNVGA